MEISKKALFTCAILVGSGCVLIGYESFSGDAPESALTKAVYILQNEARIRWYQLIYARLNLEAGRNKQLYLQNCGGCHGPDGHNGRAANLAVTRLLRAPDDAALTALIQGGIPGTSMPAIMLDARAAWQIAAHVRRLGRAPKMPGGDSALGKQLFETKGHCLECHTVGSQGATTGPDLSAIGSKRGVQALRRAILNPAASEAYQLVEIITRGGQRVTGFRANEDTFSIQVRALSGRVTSFLKDEVADVRIDRTKSLMPGYQNEFTQLEMDNVVAYLASLRGAQ